MSSHNFINYKEFENVDIRIGTVIEAYEYNELKKPSIILKIDFGEKIGIKKTSAQLQKYYQADHLINKQVIAVINFESKQIGALVSVAEQEIRRDLTAGRITKAEAASRSMQVSGIRTTLAETPVGISDIMPISGKAVNQARVKEIPVLDQYDKNRHGLDIERDLLYLLDQELKKTNIDYLAKRKNNSPITKPKLSIVRCGTFHNWMQKRGKIGGQNKVPKISNSNKYVKQLLEINQDN